MIDKKRDVLPDMDEKTAAVVARFLADPDTDPIVRREKKKATRKKKAGVKAKVGNPLGKAVRLPPDTHNKRAIGDAEAEFQRRDAARKQAYKNRTTTGKS